MLASRTIAKYAATGTLTLGLVGCRIDTVEIGGSGADAGSTAKGGAAQGSGGDSNALGGAASGGAASGGAASGGAEVTLGGRSGSGGAGTGGRASGSGGKSGYGGSAGSGGALVSTGGANNTGGKLGSGGQGPGGCACPNKPITWGRNGEFAGADIQAQLDCSGFRRGYVSAPLDAYLCELPNVGCYANWSDELKAVLTLQNNAEVQAAVAAAPIVYGRDPRLVDGAVFSVTVGGKTIDIGEPCPDTTSCIPIPAGVSAFAEALKKLERHAALDCSPECAPTPPEATPESPCAEPRYYWMYGSCEQVPDRSCAKGYATESACLQAHYQCLGLYPQRCGGFGGFCADDEYCAYRGYHACGRTDGSAVCMPKPRVCDAIGSPVCGCDNKTYGNLCEAAMAGVGELAPGECN